MKFYMLHPRELETVRKQKNAMVVDLRDNASYLQFHYKNAVNIPYAEGERWLNQFYTNRVYILYCDYGNLSLLAARKLSQRGITVYTVIGGIAEIKRLLTE